VCQLIIIEGRIFLAWEFYQIYKLGALGHKYELVSFWGQKVKVLMQPNKVKNLLLGAILSP